MTEFEEALDRWGTDLARWPAAEAERARTLLASGGPAAASLEAARRVDAHLASLQSHAPPAHLASRIVARAGTEEALAPWLDWLTARLWRPALLGLILVTGGYLTGIAATDAAVDPELANDVMALAFNDIYAELEDDAQP